MPKTIKTTLLLSFFCLFSAQIATAQEFAKELKKAKDYYAKAQYAKVFSMAEKILAKSKKNPEWYYLKAASCYFLSSNVDDKKHTFREATKAASQAITRDSLRIIYPRYETVMREITEKNNKEASGLYYQKSYARAALIYKSSYQLTGDTTAYGMIGLSYWNDKKERDALPFLKTITKWNYYAALDNISPKTYMREPFEILTEYYLEKGEFDSAQRFSEMGLNVFPLNKKLKTALKNMLLSSLQKSSSKGITAEFNGIVNKGLGYFPDDSLFLYNQNVYYLSNIQRLTDRKFWGKADSAVYEFVSAKAERINLGVKNAYDKFLTKDTLVMFTNLFDYFMRTNTQNGAVYFFKKWYMRSFKYKVYDAALAEFLLKEPPDKIPHRLINMLHKDAELLFPKNTKLRTYRLTYFEKWNAKPKHTYGEYDLLIDMNKEVRNDFPSNKKVEEALRRNFIASMDSAIDRENIYTAWERYYDMSNYFDVNTLGALKIKLAKVDFMLRYFGTKIDYIKNASGKKIANTGWNGDSKRCEYGELPDSTLYKVLDRFNYFRQNAGVMYPLQLDAERVQGCQEAAVMFAPIGVFTGSPTAATHACYTDLAAVMASVGQGVLESNPAQSVNVLMKDAKSTQLYNRLSILNPVADNLGVGAAENNSFFVIGYKGILGDSSYYKNHFISWPPAGYVPSMLMFPKWNFSIADNVKGATVEVTDAKGTKIPTTVAVSEFDTLMIKTLIFSPAIDYKTFKEGDTYTVNVTLANKRKFSYKVSIFDAKALIAMFGAKEEE